MASDKYDNPNEVGRLLQAVESLLRRIESGPPDTMLVAVPVGTQGHLWCATAPRRTVVKLLSRAVDTAVELLRESPDAFRAILFSANQVWLASQKGHKRMH